jgi:hypothetical protein
MWDTKNQTGISNAIDQNIIITKLQYQEQGAGCCFFFFYSTEELI